MNGKIVKYGYDKERNKIGITFSNGDTVSIGIHEYLRQGQKLRLIAENNGRRKVFNNEIVIIMDTHISMLLGVMGFNRIDYKKRLAAAKELIKQHRDNFDDAFTCVCNAFDSVGLQVRQVRKVLMTDSEFEEILRYAKRR